jgi:UDPglucose--hexose-1-phosphate uridylyltransferase
MPARSRVITKADGRRLTLYSNDPHSAVLSLPLQADLPPLPSLPNPHLRWHPLRREWVCYAANRQDRTFLPPPAYCPLCPTHPGGTPTEIPLTAFEVAVFDNRFPGFHLQAHSDPQTHPALDWLHQPAIGHCEVMVYGSEHQGSLGQLSQARRELIVQVWCDRISTLMHQAPIQWVMPFENRGEAVGVTLAHPHGQIYAFSYLPPVLETMRQAFAEAPIVQNLLHQSGDQYTLFTQNGIVAFVPPFQRYPYEVWLTAETFHASLDRFSDAECTGLATALGRLVTLYDQLFDTPMPYLMVVYSAPKGAEAYFQFHIQFLPFLRAAHKLKFTAGCETGAGTFLVDMLPEVTVQTLRQLL